NVIYNWGTDAAHGNPRSANLVNNWFRAGPETTRAQVWRAQTSQVAPDLVAGSVYLAGNVADGFGYKVDAPASQLAASPRCGGLSVTPEAADAAYAGVIANAGATAPLRDAVDVRVIDNVTSRKGSFVNGAGYAAPNPYWP
ncbi:MAG TPA: hypothetical protein VFH63_00730, partial [candidate division Zixibacteria bacterium]|nr:hypothetical protein [candidate division Zixibacteria bacterium]